MEDYSTTDEECSKASLKIGSMAGLHFTTCMGGPEYIVVTEGQWP